MIRYNNDEKKTIRVSALSLLKILIAVVATVSGVASASVADGAFGNPASKAINSIIGSSSRRHEATTTGTRELSLSTTTTTAAAMITTTTTTTSSATDNHRRSLSEEPEPELEPEIQAQPQPQPQPPPQPQPQVQPDLPFSDINILVVSDVHSFVGGHPHEPDRNADYGDLLSFYERLKAHCEESQSQPSSSSSPSKHNNNGGDLFLFNNGDILHGTGLAMDGNATNLLPILNAMPWDAMTMGRQEATYSDVLRDMNETLLPKIPGRYVTSNVVWADTKEPYGARYQLLKGRNSTVLVVAFLYDTVSSSETIEVISIEETIQQDWFQDILSQTTTTTTTTNDNDLQQYDAIVVMAHMDNDNPVIDTIYETIRSKVPPEMPIQFITGHSHKRQTTDLMKRDRYVHRIEPGGVFDTIGWVTIPKYETARELPPKSDGLREAFRQEFLNTSKAVLHSRLGLTGDQELRTDRGTAVSDLIHETQERLGLNQVVACPGHDFFRNISIHDNNSLWKLWREHVVRTEIFQRGEDRVMLVSKSSMRYDLRGSGKHDAMTLDDVVAIAPYMEKVVYVGDVPDWMIRRMNNTFNTFSHHNIIPDYVLAGDLDDFKTAESYKLYTHEVDVPKIKTKLEKFNFHDFVLEYTGQRDTLYWLDYVRTAFPCKGGEEAAAFVEPYFYDPNELEDETTDGKPTSEDIGTASGGGDGSDDDSSADEIWTIPPEGGYQGYVPGNGETKVVPVSVYENYKSKEEREKEAKEAREAALARARGDSKDLRTQHLERKKTHKKIIKGFALTFAGLLLLIPFGCLVMQLLGRNDYYDDYNDDIGITGGLYDQEEMQLLKRHRRRGTKPNKTGASLHSAPVKTIELV